MIIFFETLNSLLGVRILKNVNSSKYYNITNRLFFISYNIYNIFTIQLYIL